MFNPDLREVLDVVSSRYALVTAVAKRAREISSEASEEGEILEEKPVSLALEEIINGETKVIEDPTAQTNDDEEDIIEE